MLVKVLKIIFSKNYNNNALYGINAKQNKKSNSFWNQSIINIKFDR